MPDRSAIYICSSVSAFVAVALDRGTGGETFPPDPIPDTPEVSLLSDACLQSSSPSGYICLPTHAKSITPFLGVPGFFLKGSITSRH